MKLTIVQDLSTNNYIIYKRYYLFISLYFQQGVGYSKDTWVSDPALATGFSTVEEAEEFARDVVKPNSNPKLVSVKDIHL